MKGIAIAMVLAASAVTAAYADDFFSSSPGPLSASHASLDNQDHCTDCHVGNTKDLSNDKCLGCHDHNNLRDRIAAGKGFHASPIVKGKKCELCHIEHKGQQFDIMGWKNIAGNQKGFDHTNTGWKLNGKHATIDCDDCHKSIENSDFQLKPNAKENFKKLLELAGTPQSTPPEHK